MRARRVVGHLGLAGALFALSVTVTAGTDWFICERAGYLGDALGGICADPWAWFIFGANAALLFVAALHFIITRRARRAAEARLDEHLRLLRLPEDQLGVIWEREARD